jgi:CBS domain-containing protein
MQMVSELMTRDVRFVAPQESLQRAAQLMDELNVGALPVCDGGRLVGMVTDRDITIRSTAAGRSPQEAHVDEVMSTELRWCYEDQSLDDVMVQMGDSQIRRLPVVSHDEQHRLVGIVSLGDLATRMPAGAQKQEVEQVVETVSSPSEPHPPQVRPDEIAGRTGEVRAGGVAKSGEGVELPRAGEAGGTYGRGAAAGASGDPRTGKAGSGTTGNADDARRDFGVSGQDLQQDGLPPA